MVLIAYLLELILYFSNYMLSYILFILKARCVATSGVGYVVEVISQVTSTP